MTHTPDLEVRNEKLIQWFDKYLADETWKSLCLGREDFAWILGEIKELTEQRAELLAALKAVLDDLKDRSRWDDEVKAIPLGSSVYIKAEAAIAEAEGKI